jgi:hypothetical protein
MLNVSWSLTDLFSTDGMPVATGWLLKSLTGIPIFLPTECLGCGNGLATKSLTGIPIFYWQNAWTVTTGWLLNLLPAHPFFTDRMPVATGWLLNLLQACPLQKQVLMWSQVTGQRTWSKPDSSISGITCRVSSLHGPLAVLLTIRVMCGLSHGKYYRDRIHKRKMLSTWWGVAKEMRVLDRSGNWNAQYR